MPSLNTLRNIGLNLGPTALNAVQGLSNRSAAGSATTTLANGADKAIDTIQGGANQASDTLKNIYGDQKNILQPYVDAGQKTLGDLQTGIAPGGGLADPFNWMPPDLQNDPIFQRRLQQGLAAINAQSNAGGTRFTGANLQEASKYATGEANDYLAQDYARQENTFRTNQKDRLNAEMGLEGVATGQTDRLIDAGNTYGTNLSKLQQLTAQQIADLQTDKASAEAAGDIPKANSIGDILGNAAGAIDGYTLNKLKPTTPYTGAPGPVPGDPNFVGPVQPGTSLASGAIPATGAAASSSAGLAAGVGEAGLTGLSAAAAPTVGTSLATIGAAGNSVLAGTGALAAPEIAAPSLAAGAGSTGASAAVTGFLTNPVTIGVGLALATALIWKKSQVHPTANKFVGTFQKPFGDHLGKIVNSFDQAYASGQLSKADAQAMYDETAKFIADFEKDRATFAAKGSKEKKVADQAEAEMVKNFGPNYQAILGKMSDEIAGLQ